MILLGHKGRNKNFIAYFGWAQESDFKSLIEEEGRVKAPHLAWRTSWTDWLIFVFIFEISTTKFSFISLTSFLSLVLPAARE